MKAPYLEITYRRGRPLAAYLYLDRGAGEKSARTEPVGTALLIDFTESGKPIGIEITNPRQVDVTDLNQTLRKLGLPVLSDDESAPLRAA